MIKHHPGDALLLAQAAGTLGAGHSLLVASHVEGCAHCQERLQLLEAIGGAMLEELPPGVLPSRSLAETLAAIDAPPPPVRPAPVLHRPQLPSGMAWPRALRGCNATEWRWFAPGMYRSRVSLPQDPDANVFLLRMAAGKQSSMHTHSGSELTQVLWGAFHDGRALFTPGDFDEADDSFQHLPKVEPSGECICLASVEGRVVFESRLARVVGALIGM
jgi:putative transcriptional regulator